MTDGETAAATNRALPPQWACVLASLKTPSSRGGGGKNRDTKQEGWREDLAKIDGLVRSLPIRKLVKSEYQPGFLTAVQQLRRVLENAGNSTESWSTRMMLV